VIYLILRYIITTCALPSTDFFKI